MTDDMIDLARLCNERVPDDRVTYDLTHPLQLTYKDDDYWYLRGTSVRGDVLMHRWRQVRADAFLTDLDRYNGIEWTDDPNVALGRLLELERLRVAAKEER
jgi:hypothetical protein